VSHARKGVHHEGTKDTKVRKLSLFLRGELSLPSFAPFAFFAAILFLVCGFAALGVLSITCP
ncbi:MAG: hypothetical protein ACXW6J_03725, partial [Candidatus Binatia bacterium]